MSTTHLLYLHGFRSSPASTKARLTAQAVAQGFPDVAWWCPALPPSPMEAMALVVQTIEHWPHGTMAIIGSSLGGFYATHLAEKFGCKAVLLNPAVHPARDLSAYLGTNTLWHDPEQQFDFTSQHVDEFRALEVPSITHPERYFAVIAKCDEVLDWREMCGHYSGATIKLLNVGDHALSDYASHIREVLAFAGLAARTN